MKKMFLCVLVLLLLLSACHAPVETPDLNTSDPTTQNTTVPVVDPTELSADDCLLADREMLSYQAFFGENYVYADKAFFGRTDWAVFSGEKAVLFDIKYDIARDVYCVGSVAIGELYYTIPGSEDYTKGYNCLAADGVYIYFQNAEEIVQLNMRTGESRQIVSCDYINNAYICGRDALYYAAVTDGKLAINRLYIPTMQNDVLYDDFSDDTPYGESELYLYKPESTQGEVVWYFVNPAMTERLVEEVSNPESKYKSLASINISVLWEEEGALNPDLGRERLWLCKHIQEDTDIRTFMKITLNQGTGECSEELGIIDNCWFGSGYPHDHYSPEITEKEAPVPADGQWIDIPDLEPIRGEVSAVAYSDQFMPYTLYCYDSILDDGVLGERLIETPVVSVYGSFCVTEDNTLIQVSWDGSVCNTLYKVKDKVRVFDQFKDKLYFLDGNAIVELDLSEGKYRTIVEYTNIVEMHVENAGTDEAFADIYFAVARGLFVEGYLYVSEIDEIFVAGYHL